MEVACESESLDDIPFASPQKSNSAPPQHDTESNLMHRPSSPANAISSAALPTASPTHAGINAAETTSQSLPKASNGADGTATGPSRATLEASSAVDVEGSSHSQSSVEDSTMSDKSDNEKLASRQQPIPVPVVRRRSPVSRYQPLEIIWLDGDVRTLPRRLEQDLRYFCVKYKTTDLPCAKTSWKSGNTATKSGDRRRQWTLVQNDEQLFAGRFKYGSKQQIIVVQMEADHPWEEGEAEIIVYAGKLDLWAVWRGQEKVEDIPEDDYLVRCTLASSVPRIQTAAAAASPSPMAEIPANTALHFQPPTSRQYLSGANRMMHTQAIDHVTVTGEQAVNPSKRPGAWRPGKRLRGNLSNSSSDIPIAELKRKEKYAKSTRTHDTVNEVCSQLAPKCESVSVIPSASSDQTRAISILDKPQPLLGHALAHQDAAGKPKQMAPVNLGNELIRAAAATSRGQVGRVDATQLADFHGEASVSSTLQPPCLDHVNFFFEDESATIVLDCQFAIVSDVHKLFARARVAKIIDKDSLLLAARLGDEEQLVMKGIDQDFEALRQLIIEQAVTEVIIMNPH